MALLFVAIFLFFSNKATIIVTPNPQKISLSFNLEVKAQPTAAELAEKDIVEGKIETYTKAGSGSFGVLSTQAVDSSVVGQVKIVNNSNHDQTLVRTTQLQAENGVIVRTNDNVVVPKSGSVKVGVFAKEPASFSKIEPGKLIIIKLNPSLQDQIYGLAESALTNDPQEVKFLTESDIKRAKDQLSQKLADELKKENQITDNSGFILNVKSFKTDKKIGDQVDNFNLEMEIEVKVLKVNEEQLAALILKKAGNLNLSGLSVGKINISDINYTIIEENLAKSIWVKINYSLLAEIDASNSLLAKSNLVGKKIKSVEELLADQEIISSFKIMVSPSWRKTLPKQESKIKILINN